MADIAQRAIMERLALGYTRKGIASHAGVTVGFVNNVLSGKKLPGPKLLNCLGLAIRVVYEPAGDPELPIKPPASAQKLKNARRSPRTAAKPKPVPTEGVLPELNTSRVTVAVAHKLNPTKAWASFIAAHSRSADTEIDTLWVAHCRKCGTPQDSQTSLQTSQPNGLYAHLKTQGIQRPDYRQPLALGNVRPQRPNIGPEAG
jgi:transcriptional regulator with XRE-family HTH domain